MGGILQSVLPVVGGIVGGYFGGPWGAAAGSSVGEAIAGGSITQDLTAGATSYIGGEVGGSFGSGLSAAGSAGGSAAGGSLGDVSGSLGAGFDSSLFSDASQYATGSLGTDVFGNTVGGSLLGNAAGSAGGITNGVFNLGTVGGGNTGGISNAIGDLGTSQQVNPQLASTLGLNNSPVIGAQPTTTLAAPGSAGTSGANILNANPAQASTSLTSGLTAANPVGAGANAAGGFDNSLLSTANQIQTGVTGANAAGAGAAAGTGGVGGTLSNLGNSALSWIGKNPLTAAQLGLAAFEGLQQPKLPSSLQTLQNSATANLNQANSIISSGGTSSPAWAGAKASIDASINQQIQQGTESILQNAANNGMGANSLVVQQQINGLKQAAQTSQQQQYQQTLNGYVSQATSLLTGSNSALGTIGQTQLQQSTEAQQLAASLAGNALKMYANNGGNSQVASLLGTGGSGSSTPSIPNSLLMTGS